MNKGTNIKNKLKLSRTFYLLFSIYNFLDLKTKKKVFFTFFLMMITAFFESITILAVIPLISKLIGLQQTNFSLEQSQKISFLNFINDGNYTFFIILIIVSGLLKIYDLYNCTKLSVQSTHDLSKKTYLTILKRPYDFHIYGEISELMATITIYIRDTHELIYNFLRLYSSFFILISLIISLILVNVKIMIFSFTIVTSVYFFVGAYTKNKLTYTSSQQVISSNQLAKIVQESLISIRELKIWNAYKLFSNNFTKIDWALRSSQRTRIFLASFPRYVIETVGIITIAFICLFSKNFNSDALSIIPVIGTFVLGIQRLLPSFNQIYQSWSFINSFKESTKKIIEILKNNSSDVNESIIKSKYNLKSIIEFQNINFKYPKSEKSIFKDISFKIYKGDKVAIKGKSGIGKSTLLDLISGMLVPDSGKILIDQRLLNKGTSNKFLLSWRSSLAYVSQNIYFMKGTFIENIAFGTNPEEIDLRRVKYVSKLAMIDDFINSKPKKYYDTVFENGRNLSGGQKQRLGIARALYHSENMLIFDEATSAIDTLTEEKIFNNIFSSNKKITLLIISHNPNTLSYCNKSIEIKGGKVIQNIS